MKPENIEEHADLLYSVYCEAVGGVAFNGDPLPAWEAFAADPKKQLQSDAWRSVAVQSLESESALDTARELHQCEVSNVNNLMHYAQGKPDHVPVSGYAVMVRDAILQMKADRDDIETKWEELTKAIGAHGPESDPLTGTDTNDAIHQRAMEQIRTMMSDEF